MFDAQLQKYYYDMNNITYEKYISVKENGNFVFKKNINYSDVEVRNKLKSKINIYDGVLNKIGDGRFSLSKSWYESKKHLHKKIKNNVENYFKNLVKSGTNFNMWTTFKDYQGKIKGKGYTKGFVSCTARATNEYSHKTSLAYTINRFIRPTISEYFRSNGAIVNDDLYALSELLQWIWRSAIRNDEEINLYIPSERMRTLLIDWLENKIN
jgi:hypothetical protein